MLKMLLVIMSTKLESFYTYPITSNYVGGNKFKKFNTFLVSIHLNEIMTKCYVYQEKKYNVAYELPHLRQ